MNAESRRKIEMGARALEFCRAHPDTEPGTASVEARLEQLLSRANEVASAQREGLIHARAATARKADLRRAMLDVPIAHLAEVGEVAASEEHELGKTFRFKPGASTLLAFRTAARGMASAAAVHQEVLARHGLSASVMEQFGQLLDQFDAAVALGNDGRTAHIGATRELRTVAQQIVQTVRVMDGRNRQRFAEDARLLGSWLGASRVLGRRRPGATDEPVTTEGPPPPDGDVRPAA